MSGETRAAPITHTPGPWNLRDTVLGICRLIVTVEDMPAIEVSAKEFARVVAYLPNSPEDSAFEQEQRANARLITAAPELLEVLERLVAVWLNEASDEAAEASYGIAVKQAEAAIRKAKVERP